MTVYSDADGAVDSPPELNVKTASVDDLEFERLFLQQDSEDLRRLIHDLKERLGDIDALVDEDELQDREDAAEEAEAAWSSASNKRRPPPGPPSGK